VRFELIVVAGPDQGQRCVLEEGESARVLVGQSPSCGLRLTDPMVSRRHFAVEVIGSTLRLTDLESTNGTFVGGLRVFDAALAGGEAVRAGGTTFAVQASDTAAPTNLPTATSYGNVVGASPAMRRLYPLCERLAASTVPVIIEGETGTGKEVLAEALHEQGPRAAGPFVVFDCTAVPPSLLEATLFGHEKGAFTGATASREGFFEEAEGGTLLIDEIGELELGLQAKLLRALERSEVRRVGGSRWIHVDVRVLTATRRNLDEEVQAGRFRDDLFYRIAVARIELPPLRRRSGDVELLAQHFWQELGAQGSPPRSFLDRLSGYSWPGNVRELANAVARFVALGEFAEHVRAGRGAESAGATEDPIERILRLDLPLPRARSLLVEEFQRRYIARVLEQHGGNVAKAARASGLARRYFQLLRARQGR